MVFAFSPDSRPTFTKVTPRSGAVPAAAGGTGIGRARARTFSNGSTSAVRQSERRNLRRVEAKRNGPFLKKRVRESRTFFYSKARWSLQVRDLRRATEWKSRVTFLTPGEEGLPGNGQNRSLLALPLFWASPLRPLLPGASRGKRRLPLWNYRAPCAPGSFSLSPANARHCSQTRPARRRCGSIR